MLRRTSRAQHSSWMAAGPLDRRGVDQKGSGAGPGRAGTWTGSTWPGSYAGCWVGGGARRPMEQHVGEAGGGVGLGPGGWPGPGGGRAAEAAGSSGERDLLENRDGLPDDGRRLGAEDPRRRVEPSWATWTVLGARMGENVVAWTPAGPSGWARSYRRVRTASWSATSGAGGARSGRRSPTAPADGQRDRTAGSRQGCRRAARGSPPVTAVALRRLGRPTRLNTMG